MKKTVFVPLTRFPTPCTSLTMSSEKAVVQVPLSGPHISCVYPWVCPVAGSITSRKATTPSPTVSTVWLACVHERRGYLWGGLRAGGSTLGGGFGGGLGGRHGGTVGGTLGGAWWSGRLGGTVGVTLGGAWGSMLCCSLGSCTVARMRLVGGVGFGGCETVAAKILASFRMASMIWVPKRAKGAASAGFARAPARRLAASVAASTEDMAGMVALWGKNRTVLVIRSPCVSGI